MKEISMLEIGQNYRVACSNASFLKQLNDYELDLLLGYANEKWGGYLERAHDMMHANQEYPYPEYYRGGRELDYWLENEHQARMCAKVIAEIERLRMPPIVAASLPPTIAASVTSDEPKLTGREKILIHCYEQWDAIKRVDPRYNDYITFCISQKRIAYPGDSPSKAKSLVASIEKILPFLSERARQQAESEINTIRAKIL